MKTSNPINTIAASGLQALAHLSAVGIVALLMGLLTTPTMGVFRVVRTALVRPELRSDAIYRVLFHVSIAVVIWAVLFVAFLGLRSRMKTRAIRVVRRPVGSVMTETIILFPVFLLLVFGLAQLAVNNVGGILANVAVYEGARAGWIWKDEEGVRNVSSGQSKERAKIAAAMVMTPVAPGSFIGNPVLSGPAQQMRLALALSNLPVNDLYASFIPGDMQNLLATGGALDTTLTTRKYQSLWRALDDDIFIQRTLKKFTHAYHATSVDVKTSGDRVAVELEYKHFIAMPMMGRVFGSFDMVGARPGYYTTYKREYGFRSQSKNKPNAALPSNMFDDLPWSNGSEGSLRGEVGFWD